MTKLPADLPENWTQGQTVSPNGTEVGLTEQHGYNYLMKQVNATQKEVNGIQDALPDVAQQTTVEEINQKIGTEGDADTQPTVFGRLAQVKNALGEKLQEKLQEVLTKVTGIDEKIGNTTDSNATTKSGSLMGKSNVILNSAGYIKDINGRKYAAIITGTEKPLTKVTQSQTQSFTKNGFIVQSSDYVFAILGTTLKKFNKEDMSLEKELNIGFSDSFSYFLIGADDSNIYAIEFAGQNELTHIYSHKISDLSRNIAAFPPKGYEIDLSTWEDRLSFDGDNIYIAKSGKICKVNKTTMKLETEQSDVNSMMPLCGVSQEYALSISNSLELQIRSKDDLTVLKKSSKLSNLSSLTPCYFLGDDKYAFVISTNENGNANITKVDLNNPTSVISKYLTGLGLAYDRYLLDSMDESFIYLSVSSNKVLKVSKTDLSVSLETDVGATYTAPIVDDNFLYALDNTNQIMVKYNKRSDTVYNISGFKEV